MTEEAYDQSIALAALKSIVVGSVLPLLGYVLTVLIYYKKRMVYSVNTRFYGVVIVAALYLTVGTFSMFGPAMFWIRALDRLDVFPFVLGYSSITCGLGLLVFAARNLQKEEP
jgi:hypothetical protein